MCAARSGGGGGGGGSLMGGNGGGGGGAGTEDRNSPTNSSSDNTVKDEPSIMDGREPRKIPVPAAMIETISIRICPMQPLGINVKLSDKNRVMKIRATSPLHNKLCVGDRIVKLDDAPFSSQLLLRPLKSPHKSKNCSMENLDETHNHEDNKLVTMRFSVERAVFSWSRREMTTLERAPDMRMRKDLGKERKATFTGRPLKRYTVVLKRPRLPEITDMAPLGLSLRYDYRERVMVAAVAPGSVAAVHLHKWDIIKRVNDQLVATKTMCAAMIAKSLFDSGQVMLSVDVMDSPAASRDTLDMPVDVVTICANHIAMIKSGGLPKPLSSILVVRPPRPVGSIVSLRKGTVAAAAVAAPPSCVPAKADKRITLSSEKPHVEEIVSDVPEGTEFKKLKGGSDV